MKIKVLVVDDNEGLVGLIKEYFSSSDKIEVVGSVSNGEEAVKLINENKLDYDLILLDLVMPVKDGIYVLNYMKENNMQNVRVQVQLHKIFWDVNQRGV